MDWKWKRRGDRMGLMLLLLPIPSRPTMHTNVTMGILAARKLSKPAGRDIEAGPESVAARAFLNGLIDGSTDSNRKCCCEGIVLE